MEERKRAIPTFWPRMVTAGFSFHSTAREPARRIFQSLSMVGFTSSLILPPPKISCFVLEEMPSMFPFHRTRLSNLKGRVTLALPFSSETETGPVRSTSTSAADSP